jgi:hypothetical protein
VRFISQDLKRGLRKEAVVTHLAQFIPLSLSYYQLTHDHRLFLKSSSVAAT